MHFTFRCMIHSEAVFVKGIGSGFRFFVVCVVCGYPADQHCLLKRLSFLH